MRIFVQHDEHGNIVGFFIPAPDAERIAFAPSEGQAVLEVDAANIKEVAAVHGAGGDRGQRIADAREALQRHKVDVRSKKLVAK